MNHSSKLLTHTFSKHLYGAQIQASYFRRNLNSSTNDTTSSLVGQYLPKTEFWRSENKEWNVEDLRNQRAYLDCLCYTQNFVKQEDLYAIGVSLLSADGYGSALLNYYDTSITKMLQRVYPEYTWYPWLFTKCPQYFWQQQHNHRLYLDWLAEQLGIERYEDWYLLTYSTAEQYGMIGLLRHYGDSICSTLEHVYSECEWQPWKFGRVPRGFWCSKDNQRLYFNWLFETLDIPSPTDAKALSKLTKDDAKRLSKDAAVKNGMWGLLKRYKNSLSKALQQVYQLHDEHSIFTRSSYGQLRTLHALSCLTPFKLLSNYRHPQLVHTNSMHNMELDIFIPSLECALEYQGAQHYSHQHNTYQSSHQQYLHQQYSHQQYSHQQYSHQHYSHHYSHEGASRLGTVAQQQLRDSEKLQRCRELGVTLIHIPYWWNGSILSLVSTITKALHTAR